jgi:hypothetical protein
LDPAPRRLPALSDTAFLGTSALHFAASAALTIVWCDAMAAMDGMAMPGGWTMPMTWMPGQSLSVRG